MIRLHVCDGVELLQRSSRDAEIYICIRGISNALCSLEKSYYIPDLGNSMHYTNTLIVYNDNIISCVTPKALSLLMKDQKISCFSSPLPRNVLDCMKCLWPSKHFLRWTDGQRDTFLHFIFLPNSSLSPIGTKKQTFFCFFLFFVFFHSSLLLHPTPKSGLRSEMLLLGMK